MQRNPGSSISHQVDILFVGTCFCACASGLVDGMTTLSFHAWRAQRIQAPCPASRIKSTRTIIAVAAHFTAGIRLSCPPDEAQRTIPFVRWPKYDAFRTFSTGPSGNGTPLMLLQPGVPSFSKGGLHWREGGLMPSIPAFFHNRRHHCGGPGIAFDPLLRCPARGFPEPGCPPHKWPPLAPLPGQ